MGAAERLLRMLSIVPWIEAHDGPTIQEVTARFGIPRKQLLEDLQVLQFVGLPPYTPDMLIEVNQVGDRVWVRLADVFAQPLRLTPDQALALIAAGEALRTAGDPGAGEGDVPEDGPLTTGLRKLARVLGIEPAEAIGIHLGGSRPGVLGTLQQAVKEHEQIEIDYLSYGRDARTTRTVEPHRVFAEGGAWYLRGYCHLAEDVRLFRLDRVVSAERLGVAFTPPDSEDKGEAVFEPDPAAPRVTLALSADAEWVANQYPVERVGRRADGKLEVTLAISSVGWLEKLLVRLGQHAVVTDDGGSGLADVGRAAARRVLARYRRCTGEGAGFG